MQAQDLFQSLVSFFVDDDWDFQELDDLPVLKMGFKGRNGQWTCFAQARQAQEQIVFYSVAPISVPEHKRHDIAEYITRANYGMIIGNFEMDYSDGEVRYKTSLDIEGATLTGSMIRQIVYSNVLIMDRYLPGFYSVMYDHASPAEAVERIESGGDTPPAPPSEIDPPHLLN